MQVSVQQLAVEAAVHASRELALQALLIDPVIIALRPHQIPRRIMAGEQALYSTLYLNTPFGIGCRRAPPRFTLPQQQNASLFRRFCTPLPANKQRPERCGEAKKSDTPGNRCDVQ